MSNSEPNTPNSKLERGGLVPGGESTSHDNGGKEYPLQGTSTIIEEEGLEANIPIEVLQIKGKYKFTGANFYVINEILKLAKNTSIGKEISLAKDVSTVRAGDVVICKASLWDTTVRTYEGEIIEIVSAVNESGGCNHVASGAKVTDVETGEVQYMKNGGTIKKSSIPGIHYEVTTIASSKYLKIIHDQSGLSIINFTSAPVQRITDIIKASEEILSKVNWNIPESQLTEEHGKTVLELKRKIEVDAHTGKYVVKMGKGGVLKSLWENIKQLGRDIKSDIESLKEIQKRLQEDLVNLKEEYDAGRISKTQYEAGVSLVKSLQFKDGGEIPSDELVLNSAGGYDYSGEAKKIAKTCGLVTLPKSIEGTNCGNCVFFKDNFCDHSKILLPVTSRQCCSLWDNKSLRSIFQNIWDAYLYPDKSGKDFPLNDRGGYEYSGKALEIARSVDLITLPEDIKGTTCAIGNCKYAVSGGGAGEIFCNHPKINLPVTDRMSCGWYDNENIIRPWGTPVEIEFAHNGGKISGKQRMKDWQAENPNSPRWKKKKERIQELANNIRSLKVNVSKFLNDYIR